MALSIKDRETERLARALAERTGESLTLATRRALPVVDPRSADEIIGYDRNGLPS